MSTCISQHGEYSSHELNTEYVCTLCGVLDEDALIAELRQLRTLIRSVDLLGTGFVWQRRDGQRLVLDPTEVTVVFAGDAPDPYAEAQERSLQRGRAEAIADLRDDAAYHAHQMETGEYDGGRQFLADYLEAKERWA